MTQVATATWASCVTLTYTTALLVGVAATAHGRGYYGGTLHWEADDSTPPLEGFVRIRIVSSLALHSTANCSLNKTWSCPAGSAEPQVQGRYRCAGASEGDGWKMLTSSFTMLTKGGTAEHRSCCWCNASLVSATETKPPLDSYGYLLASSIDPRTRSDTNQSNNSPKVAFPPLLRVNGACESEQRVVASDADGDRVRCRYARGPECEDGGCGTFPNAQLLEDLCVFRFGGPTRGLPLAGTYGVTVVVEDTPASTIHLDESAKGPYDVLSSVPLHFTVVVSYSGFPCTSKPAFVGLTPLPGASLCTQVGRTLNVPINVVTFQTPPADASITHVVVYGQDILTGSVARNYKDPSLFQTYLKWKIASNDVGKHLICFFAVDSAGQQSDLRCITVVVSDSYLPFQRILEKLSPLAPVQMSISSNATYADTVTFIVTFSDPVVSTLDARAHVRFYEVESGRLAHRINASDCARVRVNPHDERELSVSTPPFTFRGATRYCMKLDGAVVQGAVVQGATRVDSEPHEECTWIFFFQRIVFASGCGGGDPHYKSFDGLRFDYMGTKPFLLAGTCNKTADEWAVYAKNERWGTQTVSWTKKAWIFVHGFQVVLDSSGAWVNDVAVNMPYRDPLYQFHIFKSQNDHVLRTNLEFSVKFGDSRVVVELENPVRYGSMTCGLLGNYDGSVADDWTAPDFSATTGALFGNYWIVDFLGESGLPDDGSSSRFGQQRAGTLFGSADACKELDAGESGPLAECSATVAMGPYHAACVYDLSVEHLMDMHAGLCRALQAYVDDCYAAGGRVNATWRNVTGCMHSCPPTSVYSTVASACPASCGDHNAELGCGDPPREGCVCPAGHIWDKDSCVLPSECGCTSSGKYFPVGDSYMDGNCSVRCTCMSLDVASCQPYVHNATTSYCGVDADGVHGSHPRWATCYVGGSNRFKTFDGYPYTYQGTQHLVLAKPCGSQSGEAWSVLVKSKPLLPLWTGSELLEVHVSVYGLTLKLFRSGNLLVDGMPTGVPFMYPSRDSHLLVVANSGSFLILDTAAVLGLQVHLDLGAGYAYVRVRTSYWGRVCGLCGNMNGDAADDLRLPTGAIARDAAVFGDAWAAAAVDWNAGFKQGAPSAAVVVDARLLNNSCARLLGDAVLRRCHGVVDVVPHYDNCVADLPLEPAVPAACRALAAYAAVCALAGVPLWDWRASTRCLAPACPQNSHHETCAVSCPPTCTDLQAEKDCVVKAPCLEGCTCDFGFVWSGGRCVLPDQCGCIDGARYYEVGSTFRNANCTSLCKCTPSRRVVCSPFPCEGFCVLKDENRYCVPKKKQCHTVGDSHYRTFDGMTFDVHHACNYTLLTLLSKPGCSVVARLEQKPLSATASTVALYITEGADTITLARGTAVYLNPTHLYWIRGSIPKRFPWNPCCCQFGVGTPWHPNSPSSNSDWDENPLLTGETNCKMIVDGIRRNLPVATASFVVLESAGHVVLFSIAEPYLVRYDGRGTAMIEVLSLTNRTGGLCGNNNGREDDFGDVVAFANSWAAPPNNSNCDLRNSAALGTTPQWAAPAASSGACWVLTNPTGPFAACHAVRSPAWWFQSCVADAALPGGHEPTAACALLHDYHALCREVSVYVGEWRAAARCELACPPHSQYTLCAQMCPPSCATADEEVVCDWPCVEGCQCHVGYFKHDGECVAQEDCGCVEESSGGGFFYHPINAEFYNSNCSLLYTCQRNRTLTSAPTVCPASQCRFSDGAYRCEQDGRMEVECRDERMVARIPKDVLLGHGAASLRLRTQAAGCALRDDGKFVTFNVSLAGCGTDFEEKESDFVFTQTVTLATADSSMVVTYDYINILVNAICKIPRFKLLSQGVFKANWSKMSLEQIAYARLDLKMDFYMDAQFTEALSPSQYPLSVSLGQYLYLQVSIKSSLDLALFTIDCYATPTSNSQDLVKHYLISDGCLATNVHNHTASRTMQRFSFKAFSFTMANAHHFYVHCYMLVCKTTELDSRCWRGCVTQQQQQRRRSSSSISSVSTPVYLLTRGPLVRWSDEIPALEGMVHFSTPVMMVVAACATALLVLAVCVIKLNSGRIFFPCMRK